MKALQRVLILGGGIAGATTAERLSRAGVECCLVERQPVIGGYAAEMGCKATDICLRCNVCVATDIFKAALKAPRTQVLTRARLIEMTPGGKTALYRAVIASDPGFIDHALCIACGACVEACPEKCVVNMHPAIYGGKPVLETGRCRRAHGKKCDKCASVCPVKAIDLDEKPATREYQFDAVVAATGYLPFDPARQSCYGYGSVANVITGLEAERQLARSSRIVRPSDNQAPQRVAFIQCVGSRSEHAHRRPEDTDYCSTVCCAYALRMARKIAHAVPGAALAVFYMDLQNFGKGFDAFLGECGKSMTFIRARPIDIERGANGAVVVKYEDQTKGAPAAAEFDLAILAVGLRPADDARTTADQLRVALDEYGFMGIKDMAGTGDSLRQNIYCAGACEGPKDIAGSIGQAEAVCAEILGRSNVGISKLPQRCTKNTKKEFTLSAL